LQSHFNLGRAASGSYTDEEATDAVCYALGSAGLRVLALVFIKKSLGNAMQCNAKHVFESVCLARALLRLNRFALRTVPNIETLL
jgi:hypothetical protein